MKPKKPLIYLASPYSSDNPAVMENRHAAACTAAASFMAGGLVVFSPIAHTHILSRSLPSFLRNDHEFWMDQDLSILKKCDALAVLCLPGWEDSRGVKEELAFAKKQHLPTFLINPPSPNSIMRSIREIADEL
jgi:nucleoside 2-deoxyribosyltransferase